MPIRFHLFRACPSVPNFVFTLLFISSFNAFALLLVTDPTVGIFGNVNWHINTYIQAGREWSHIHPDLQI